MAHQNLLEDDQQIAALVRSSQRIAVLGIKPETHADQPAHFVPAFLQAAGAEVIPVPVYYPEVKEILGRPVVRDLRQVKGPIDIVDVFRRPADVAGHVDDLIALRPKAVWLQAGIRNDRAAEQLAAAGILVVQDRCLKVEWRRFRSAG